ncbi:MAG: hypothetical protein ACLQVK_15350 [Acidimicrobiales bacterium]
MLAPRTLTWVRPGALARACAGVAVALLVPPGAGAETVGSSALTAASDGVTVKGTSLYLNGAPWHFSGINVPEAATDYEVNGGCGASLDLLAFFDSLAPDSVVRVSFGQDATIDEGRCFSRASISRDWRALDRVVAAADESTTHARLIVGLGGQGGTCDGGAFKTAGWYQSGYLRPYVAQDGYSRSSYWDYLREVVSRYAGNPAIFMWEPMGEPEAADCAPGYRGTECYSHKCPLDATTTLVNWFDMRAKLDAAVSAGVAGWVPWTYGTGTNNACDYYIMPGDPVLGVLARVPAT